MSFGLPTDTSDTEHVNSAWNLFAAAMSTDTSVRNSLISKVRARASFNQSLGGFHVTYDAQSSQTTSGQASPAQGAMYAPLALLVSPTPITFSPLSSSNTGPPKEKHSHIGAIIGGILGGAGIGILLAVFLVRRKRLRSGSAFFRHNNGLNLIEGLDHHDSAGHNMPDYGPAWQANIVSRPSADVLLQPDPVVAPIVSFPPSKPDPAVANLSGKELARYRADMSTAPVDRADMSTVPVNRVVMTVTPSVASCSSGMDGASETMPPTSESSLAPTDSRQAWQRLGSEPSTRNQQPLTAGASDGHSNRVHNEVEDLRREI
ncbi:hypothetical protein EWM64_g901 [Hericium alpestre]|uniref:Glutaminase A central domain-containing protein n=1 Tax=Hericium alpestre TaxID=135208 RepID=A0A4Z0A9Y9_9AGAM|nr:hypothetical protein EWM64_g901 [Hericium alpestre]